LLFSHPDKTLFTLLGNKVVTAPVDAYVVCARKETWPKMKALDEKVGPLLSIRKGNPAVRM